MGTGRGRPGQECARSHGAEGTQEARARAWSEWTDCWSTQWERSRYLTTLDQEGEKETGWVGEDLGCQMVGGRADKARWKASQACKVSRLWALSEQGLERRLQAGPAWPADPAQPLGLDAKEGDSGPFPLSNFLLRLSGWKPRSSPVLNPQKRRREHAQLP